MVPSNVGEASHVIALRHSWPSSTSRRYPRYRRRCRGSVNATSCVSAGQVSAPPAMPLAAQPVPVRRDCHPTGRRRTRIVRGLVRAYVPIAISRSGRVTEAGSAVLLPRTIHRDSSLKIQRAMLHDTDPDGDSMLFCYGTTRLPGLLSRLRSDSRAVGPK